MEYTNITKEHVLEALKLIDENGIPKEKESIKYDVFYSNKRYPSKYVISLAYQKAYGVELDHNSFSASLAIKYLKSISILVIYKNVNIWKVSQPEENRNEGYEQFTCSQGWNYGGDLSWVFYNYHIKDIKLGYKFSSINIDTECP